MIAGNSLRNISILLVCLALSIFVAESFLGQSFGFPSLDRFRHPLEWQSKIEHSTTKPTTELNQHEETSPSPTSAEVAIVVASQTSDNTKWLGDIYPEWKKYIYVTDDSNARLTVPKNKGREGMVYLSYVIDNYDRLPEIVLFRHAERYQWHSDDPLFDGQRLLSRIQLHYIRQKGYTNLRCGWILTCPSSVRPLDDARAPGSPYDPEEEDMTAGSFVKGAFEQLFPGEEVPEEIGGPCCAQFAVTAERIRHRPKADYERFRTWLIETPLNDDLSGRIMEYSWHIIFGEPAVSCPLASECYCGLYGICHLHCEEEGDCKEQYSMPEYSGMPEGWPDYGWEGEWRNVTEMRIQYDEKHPLITHT